MSHLMRLTQMFLEKREKKRMTEQKRSAIYIHQDAKLHRGAELVCFSVKSGRRKRLLSRRIYIIHPYFCHPLSVLAMCLLNKAMRKPARSLHETLKRQKQQLNY